MTEQVVLRRKLIEVALPLEAINDASAREKSIRHGHPSTLHLWWARRPLAAARAVIFAQMVDDPSSHPERFPTPEAQETERQRLFRLIEELVKWENTTNEDVLSRARDEIWKSWRSTCADNRDHPRAAELFNPDKLPAFHDPFAGGGSLPLEAQRLGLEAHASDLNPVAVLINKAMIEIPPKFAGRPPVNPDSRWAVQPSLTPPSAPLSRCAGEGTGVRDPSPFARQWRGAQGLAEDVRYYGKWMRDEAERRIGHLYPKIEITAEMAKERPDLKPLVGRKLTVIAWLWARTVKSPNPAFAHVDVPLVSSFMLSTKPGKEAYVEPVIENGGYRFTVRVGKPKDPEAAQNGTKLARGANFRCLMSGAPIDDRHIKSESMSGRMSARLMAIVAEGPSCRVYLAPTESHARVAASATPVWKPDEPMNRQTKDLVSGRGYGFFTWADLFTPRQLVALTTFSDLVAEARERVRQDALAAGLPDDGRPLAAGGIGAKAYADAVGVYLAFAVSKTSNRCSSLCTFKIGVECPGDTFGRQALPMSWDFAEANTVCGPSGSFDSMLSNTLAGLNSTGVHHVSPAVIFVADAALQSISLGKVVSTDPPYYDNVGYADLSDFFYVWLRRSLRDVYPDLFATLAVPKAEELIASPYRQGSKEKAEAFFLAGMTQAMRRIAEQAHAAFPVTIYYAYKQAESEGETLTPPSAPLSRVAGEGTGVRVSTGWDTFLEAVIRAGFAITGTWPMRTERENRKINQGANALASSVVLVCRARSADAPTATRREFLSCLRAELPAALADLQRGNIAPVDLAQAAIGPGVAVFTRYSRVLDAAGNPMPVREALALINQTLDEVLAEQEGDFDADTRWAVAWFEQFGFAEGEYGVAETLSKAKNTSVDGMVEAGIVKAGRGKVRLLGPDELDPDWDPAADRRLTIWEITHHLIRALKRSESEAAALAARIGSRAGIARELAYRLYVICDRKRRAPEALAYNSLVQSWPEIAWLASQSRQSEPTQSSFI